MDKNELKIRRASNEQILSVQIKSELRTETKSEPNPNSPNPIKKTKQMVN